MLKSVRLWSMVMDMQMIKNGNHYKKTVEREKTWQRETAQIHVKDMRTRRTCRVLIMFRPWRVYGCMLQIVHAGSVPIGVWSTPVQSTLLWWSRYQILDKFSLVSSYILSLVMLFVELDIKLACLIKFCKASYIYKTQWRFMINL